MRFNFTTGCPTRSINRDHEGRYHLVKRLMDRVGHPVVKLKRIAFGPLKLEGLPRGTFREVTGREMAALKAEVNLT